VSGVELPFLKALLSIHKIIAIWTERFKARNGQLWEWKDRNGISAAVSLQHKKKKEVKKQQSS